MDQKPIDLTGRRAPPAGRLRNAPWPLASASMTDGRRKMQAEALLYFELSKFV